MQPESSVPTAGPEGETTIASDEAAEERALVRRIVRFSIAAWIVMAAIWALRAEWWGLAGLTCSGAVVIINFLWLEEIISHVLRPAPRANAWRLGVRALARFALFGVALAVSIFVVRFNPLSVLFGFSILVIGIGCEVLYAVYRDGGRAA
ncbi:MAG TPA: ATP synthase subunit I [Thermoanaerobaculia bacterium]|nr:ATP synthase subunit I [Thermoanaerobaculia bacterium]